MLERERLNRVLWAITGALALIAALGGLLAPSLYFGVVPARVLPGALSQDLVTVGVGAALLVLAATARAPRHKQQMLAFGLLGFLFYGYGVYSIEQVYNALYLVYLAVFALSFWALVVGGISLRREVVAAARLPRWTRIVSFCGALLQPLVFYPLWIASLLPLMAEHRQIRSYYSIYVLDLCFIMPAFFVLAILVLRARGLGLVLAPAMFLFGGVLMLSLALGPLVAPRRDLQIDLGSIALAALFFALGGLHLGLLRIESSPITGPPAAERGRGADGRSSVLQGQPGRK
jgi:hypothetical protein